MNNDEINVAYPKDISMNDQGKNRIVNGDMKAYPAPGQVPQPSEEYAQEQPPKEVWKSFSIKFSSDVPRQGWFGVWDALKSAITNTPRFMVKEPLTLTFHGKGVYGASIAGIQLEKGEVNLPPEPSFADFNKHYSTQNPKKDSSNEG